MRNSLNGLPIVKPLWRPEVRQIKKRESLLLKGQSDELSANFGSERSNVFRKAYDRINGQISMPVSPNRGINPLKIQATNEPISELKSKLQFRIPLVENTIIRAAASLDANENLNHTASLRSQT